MASEREGWSSDECLELGVGESLGPAAVLDADAVEGLAVALREAEEQLAYQVLKAAGRDAHQLELQAAASGA